MAEKKMPINLFVQELEAALERKDGYIMGARGQDPKKLNSWYFEQYADRSDYTEKQEKKALYWREHAERVWDCNGLPEGIYQDYTGKNINTKARYNYMEWCEPKGEGMIPPEYRVPGAAVFTGDKPSKIPHVMYLYKPVEAGKPEGDWYLIEARGVLYGVVKTKLSSRKPTFWGHMTKYFDYGSEAEAAPKPEAKPEVEAEKKYVLGDRLLKNTAPDTKGDDVRELQTRLNALGYSCGTVDGLFGSNTEKGVRAFQKAAGIEVDGEFGPESLKALKAAESAGKADYTLYTVKKGDALWLIADKLLGSGARYKEIVKLNSLKSTVIQPGQELKIPKK